MIYFTPNVGSLCVLFIIWNVWLISGGFVHWSVGWSKWWFNLRSPAHLGFCIEVGKQHVLFTAYFLPQCLLSLPCTSHFHLHSPSYSKELVMDCILLLFLCGRIHYQTNPWSRADMFVHVILVFLLMFSPLQLFFD